VQSLRQCAASAGTARAGRKEKVKEWDCSGSALSGSRQGTSVGLVVRATLEKQNPARETLAGF